MNRQWFLGTEISAYSLTEQFSSKVVNFFVYENAYVWVVFKFYFLCFFLLWFVFVYTFSSPLHFFFSSSSHVDEMFQKLGRFVAIKLFGSNVSLFLYFCHKFSCKMQRCELNMILTKSLFVERLLCFFISVTNFLHALQFSLNPLSINYGYFLSASC